MGMIETTLILADIHHRVNQATKIVKEVGADKVISLGDIFDDFNDTPDNVRESCEWLEWFVSNPNHIYLAGNHCMHYAFPTNESFRCSGYAQWKSFIIQDTVDPSVWKKMKYYHILDNTWFLSHGGLHKNHLPENIAYLYQDRPRFLKSISEYLDDEIIKGHRENSWVFRAGRSRGGFQPVGGLTWCDFEREFYPIRGLNQLVGHTPQGLGFPKWCILNQEKVSFSPYDLITPTREQLDNPNLSYNLDLDVQGNTHYAVWDGKKLTLGNYRDL